MKISAREKRFILIGVLAGLAQLAYLYVIEPVVVSQVEVRKQIQTKQALLERHRPSEPGADHHRARLEAMQVQRREADGLLLKEQKTALAAAKLQGLLHEIGRETRLTMVRENVLAVTKIGPFVAVPIELSVRGDMKAVRDFLYRVETAPYLLSLPRLTIREGFQRAGGDLSAELQVVGYIQGEEKK